MLCFDFRVQVLLVPPINDDIECCLLAVYLQQGSAATMVRVPKKANKANIKRYTTATP